MKGLGLFLGLMTLTGVLGWCAETTNSHSDLLIVPAGAHDVRYGSKELSDYVSFQFQTVFPAQALTERILKSWEKRGYYQDAKADASWKFSLSKDRHTLTKGRTIETFNAKAQRAKLTLAYIKHFDWALTNTQAETVDMDDTVHVLETTTPVRP